MKRFLVLGLLMLLARPSVAAATATARFGEYLATLSKARTLAEVRPFFTNKGWAQGFGEFESYPAEDQREAVKAVAAEFAGWKVKKESVKDGKTILLIGHSDSKNKDTEVLMVKQNGVWLIDG